MSRKKSWSAAERRVFDQLAAVTVCLEIEARCVAPAVAESTGKPYDPASQTSFSNTFLNANPEYKRAWNTFLRAVRKHRQTQLDMARSKHER
ncbi:hypothetical protein AB2523_25130 [Klebsiella michiganensis]|uniref:hypothetical protein n=1 Tax=Klebsiella michiganensis TaxID=1134687 RepID=UPI003464300E